MPSRRMSEGIAKLQAARFSPRQGDLTSPTLPGGQGMWSKYSSEADRLIGCPNPRLAGVWEGATDGLTSHARLHHRLGRPGAATAE